MDQRECETCHVHKKVKDARVKEFVKLESVLKLTQQLCKDQLEEIRVLKEQVQNENN